MRQKKSQEYHKQYHVTRAKKSYAIKKEKVNELKQNPCVDCGNTFHHAAMDFDHIDGGKVASVSWLINNRSWESVLKEIEKCELVCSNCHRVRTCSRMHSE